MCRAVIRALSLKLAVGPLTVVNMAPDECHGSSARSDVVGPFTSVDAHELHGLAVESPDVPRPLRMSLSTSLKYFQKWQLEPVPSRQQGIWLQRFGWNRV
jgi:hypothetical protein